MEFGPSNPIEAYQPNHETLEALQQSRLVALVGPTAVGKTTVIARALVADTEIHAVVPETSRAPRPGEADGVDYHFRSRADMIQAAAHGEYVQAVVNPTGDLYATRLNEYPPDKIAAIPMIAATIPFMRSLPFRDMETVFVVPPNFDTWQERMHGRFNEKQLVGRMHEARQSLQFGLTDTDSRYLVNDAIDQATADFQGLVHGLPLTARQAEQQEEGRSIAGEMLQRLDTMLIEN